MSELEIGQTAPAFSLPTQSGDTVALADHRRQVVVLYFYPKDDTPGCTLEGKDFSALAAEFETVGAVVFGVSRDSIQSHAKFAAKCDLTIPLLADTTEEVCTAYGVLKEKNMYGKKVFGIERTTFVIDREGRIAKMYPKVKVDGHAAEVLSFVQSLQ